MRNAFFRKPVAAKVILEALTELASRVRPRVTAPREELDTLKEYSEKLVHMLEERNRELEATRQQLVATNEALRESEASFRGVFLANPVATSLSEIESGRFLDFNDSMMQLLGYEREDLLGRTSVELGIWTDTAEREQLVASVSGSPFDPQSGAAPAPEDRRIDPGSWPPSSCSDLAGSWFSSRSSRRHPRACGPWQALRESEERYRSLFDLTPLPMFLFDPESFAILAVNIAAGRALRLLP